MDDFGHIQVGTKMELKTGVLGNPPGTEGVCYEVYQIGEHTGYSFIFPNGSFDGFSVADVKLFFDTSSDSFVPELHLYKFKNVIKLAEDFRNGKFDIAWKK